VLFDDWRAHEGRAVLTAELSPIAPYEPGAFYKRELPLLLAVLNKVRDPLEAIIIGGYVWLGANTPGLGTHLHSEIGAPIIGVAKSKFRGDGRSISILRGRSAGPLYVTAVGMEAHAAADHIRAMHGAFQIPLLLGLADRYARVGGGPNALSPRVPGTSRRQKKQIK
jgi:deoxyribonuclease V